MVYSKSDETGGDASPQSCFLIGIAVHALHSPMDNEVQPMITSVTDLHLQLSVGMPQ